MARSSTNTRRLVCKVLSGIHKSKIKNEFLVEVYNRYIPSVIAYRTFVRTCLWLSDLHVLTITKRSMGRAKGIVLVVTEFDKNKLRNVMAAIEREQA